MPTLPGSQSEWIVGAIVAAFLLWLAAKQRLGVYWSLFSGGGASTSSAAGSSAGSAIGGAVGGAVNAVTGAVSSAATPTSSTSGTSSTTPIAPTLGSSPYTITLDGNVVEHTAASIGGVYSPVSF